MSYSTLFKSGLSLASLPRSEPEAQAALRPPSLQINIHPGTPRHRMRKRRSSLTIAVSPIGAVKSPLWTAGDSLRVVLRSPREGTFLESLQNSTKSKTIRRKNVSSIEPPPLPAPTTPLPTLPPAHIDISASTSFSSVPADDLYSSSLITSESTFTSRPAWIGHNPSRKSSSLLPSFGHSRVSSASGREPLTSSPYAGNKSADDLDTNTVEEKVVPATVWFDDDDEDMKENDSEA